MSPALILSQMLYCSTVFPSLDQIIIRFVAGTSRRFKEIYSIKHERKTTWENAASSVACAELCLDDFNENGGEEEDTDCLKMTTKGAMKIGNIKVLEWARIKGFEFDSEHFHISTCYGHLCVLQWAEEKNLEWYGEDTLMSSCFRRSYSYL